MIRKMDMENITGTMDEFFKENGKMENAVGEDEFFIPMVQ